MDFTKTYQNLKKFLSEKQIKIDEPMRNHTSFHIGGPADIMVLPKNPNEVCNIIKFCKQNKIPFFVMGNGTNLLIKDEGIRGVVMKLAQNYNDAEVDKHTIKCKAGMALSTAAKIALENCLSGLEFANGIPGTVGGAAVMNAGAYGGEMADVIKKAVVMDMDGNLYEMCKTDLEYSYRRCVLQNGDRILLEVEMELVPGDYDDIKRKMEDYLARRRNKQPLNLPSAGSAFKRPPDNFAGALIEKAGLKGYRMGGAMVSDKHAGFIVNVDNATFDDVQKLIHHVQKRIKEKFNVNLESEIKIKGG
ncbi:MAG: UDP-N-acetylmuramate dehydrogenase [Tepidanaerobacteraceae bacterium]|nr:UDP-N-acetylmuramate dehydrogenase [Tepidanaerobacteraceae bacterium]